MATPLDSTLQVYKSETDYLRRARDYLSERNILLALETLRRAFERFPQLQERPEALVLRGRIARCRERFKEARGQLRRAAAADPALAVECRYELGRIWLEAGRPELAVEALLEVAENRNALIPYRAHALSGLCVAFTALERMGSAEKAIQSAAGFGLISGQLLADEAFHLTAEGAVQEAQAQLARAIQIDVGCVDAFFQLASLFHVHGRGKEAKEILAYGIENSPHALKLYALMAEIHYSLGEYREAAAFHRRCLEISPEGANADHARLDFARCFYAAGRTEQAVGELHTLLKRHPRSNLRREARERLANLDGGGVDNHVIRKFPRTLQKKNYCGPNTLANIFKHHGLERTQDEIAEEVITEGAHWQDLVRFMRQTPGFRTFAFLCDLPRLKALIDSDIPVLVGEYWGLDGHALALIGYDDHMGVVVAQDPRFYDPVEITYQEFRRTWAFTDNLAVVAVPAARAAIVEKIERDGEALVERWLRALELRALGKLDEAKQVLVRLLGEEPAYGSARRALVEIALMESDYKEASRLLDEELERDEHCYWALRYAGDVALATEDLAAALDWYGKAVRIFPDDPTLRYARGEISLLAGDRKRGRAELVAALEAHPASVLPRLRLARDYLASGDLRHASYHVVAVREIDPGNEEAAALTADIERASEETQP